MSAFLAMLLAAIGPLLVELLQTLLKNLIEKWKTKPEAAAIISAATTPDKLHAAMPKLFDLVASDFDGPLSLLKRLRFNRLRSKLEKRAVTNAMWDQLLMSGDVQGEPTGVSFVEVLDALQ